MKKHRHAVAAALLLAVVVVGILFLRRPDEPTFRGKPESFWITNIVYHGPSEQIDQWLGFGAEGVQLLTRYLDQETGWRRTYRKAYRLHAAKLPQVIVRPFPVPDDNRSTRMRVLNLLSSMTSRDTNTARLAEPAIARAMADENPALRQNAVGSYEGQILRTQIRPGLKKARLNEFLRLAEDDNHWVRGNAAVVLYYFPEEAARIVPVLIRILSEPHPHLQLTIARSLARVDREAAAKAGVATIAAGHLKDPEKGFKDPTLQRWNAWEIVRQAAEVLGELHAEPAVSLPALIEGLGSTNREIAIASFRALTRFKEQADQVIPALRKAAAERSDIPNWVKAELRNIDPAGRIAR
jgi:hypothetical protein